MTKNLLGVMLVCGLGGFGGGVAAQGTWLSWDSMPFAAVRPAAAYDWMRERTVVWGGVLGTTPISVTLEFNGVGWYQVGTPQSPPATTACTAMAYDRSRSRCVLVLPDAAGWARTWEYDGSTWTERQLPVVPWLGSEQFELVYDAARGVDVLLARNGMQTWEYNGWSWVQRAVASIGPRRDTVMVYDAHRGRTVVHGGMGTTLPLGDTWEYDGNQWGLVSSGPRYTVGYAAYDLHRRRTVLVVHAGASAGVHEFTGSSWQAVSTTGGPAPWVGAFMTYHAASGCAVFGGGLEGTSTPGVFWRFGSAQPAVATPYGQGCAGSWGLASFVPQPWHVPYVGMPFGARLYGAPWGQPAFVAFGFSRTSVAGTPLPLSLTPFGFTNCSMLTSGEILLPTVGTTTQSTVSFGVPADLGLVGAWFYLQAFAHDPAANPAGWITTHALECRIGRP